MSRGLMGQRAAPGPQAKGWKIAVAAALIFTTGAGWAFAWDYKDASASSSDARIAAWAGDLRQRRQAITQLSDEVQSVLEIFSQLTTEGDEQSKKLAENALRRAFRLLKKLAIKDD